MTDATLVRVGRSISILGIAAAIAVMAVHASLGLLHVTFHSFNLHTALFCVVLGAVAWVAMPQQPRNVAVWMMVASLAFGATELFSWTLTAALTVSELGEDVYRSVAELEGSASDLTTGIAWGFWVGWWAWLPSFLGFLSLGLLWFPNGRLPSKRWRWAAAVAGVGLSLTTIGHAIVFRPGSTVPYETTSNYPGFGGLLITIGFPTLGAGILAAVASLFVRYRAGDTVVRHQLRWIGLGAATLGGSFLATLPIGTTAMATVSLATLPLFLGGYGIAILKYRLYDVDIVISKTLTFGALAVFITAVYALIVVGLGSLIDQAEEPNLWLSVGAIAIIAVLFEPIHSRVRRLANQLIYGERATPYAVLAQLSARFSTSEAGQEALAELAKVVASGTGAAETVVWVRIGDQFRAVAAWPEAAHPAHDRGAVDDLDSDLAVPVLDGVEVVGAIAVEKARGEVVTEPDRSLVADVAAGAALVMRNIRLNDELSERAEQLRASRRRLVAAHDSERHRLERDLHDGAQQQIVALKVKLGLARAVAEREGAAEVARHIEGLADESQEVVDEMRVVARGLYPPLLEAEGLRAALGAVPRSVSIPLDVEVDGIGRYPRPIEETVYFCVLETVENAVQSGARGVAVSVTAESSALRVEINHDGRTSESDVAAVLDRVDALGGSTSVEAMNGARNRVVTMIPVDAEADGA